jgi:lipoate-protein ligase A
MGWTVEHHELAAGDFHRRMPDDLAGPEIWIATIPGPALVLGSTQSDDLIDRRTAAADGYEVCRRRSGGGLVHIDPATDCWIDAIVPRQSDLWHDDVGRAFHWIGQLWAEVLADSLGEGPAPVVHRGPARGSGQLWCFGGLGSGEVTIGGYKVVGLSQRRTRNWARLQTLVLGRWPGPELGRYIADQQQLTEADDPAAVAAGPPPGTTLPSPTDLTAAFLQRLPAP